MHWKMVVLLCNVAMWECYCIATASTIASFAAIVIALAS